MNSEKNDKYANRSVHIEGDVSNSIVVTGSKNIIVIVTDIVGKAVPDRNLSIKYKDMGKGKLVEWGTQMRKFGEWDWYLLAHSMEFYMNSIKYDAEQQESWIYLAYLFHLLGQTSKAKESLGTSLQLGVNENTFEADNYERVRHAIENGSYLSGGRVVTPAIPDWFQRKFRSVLA